MIIFITLLLPLHHPTPLPVGFLEPFSTIISPCLDCYRNLCSSAIISSGTRHHHHKRQATLSFPHTPSPRNIPTNFQTAYPQPSLPIPTVRLINSMNISITRSSSRPNGIHGVVLHSPSHNIPTTTSRWTSTFVSRFPWV